MSRKFRITPTVRLGINSQAHSKSPLKRTKIFKSKLSVHFSGLELLACELIRKRAKTTGVRCEYRFLC